MSGQSGQPGASGAGDLEHLKVNHFCSVTSHLFLHARDFYWLQSINIAMNNQMKGALPHDLPPPPPHPPGPEDEC